MKYKKIISFILVLCMVFSDLAPIVYGVETESETDTIFVEEVISESDNELKEDSNYDLTVEVLESDELPTEESENTESSQEDETDNLMDDVDETVTEDSFSVFKGVSEDYTLSRQQIEIKESLVNQNYAENFKNTAKYGDYVPGQLLYMTENRDDAQLVAEAYSAQFSDYNGMVAVFDLPRDIPVYLALEYGQQENNVPPVTPNIIYDCRPVEIEKEEEISLHGFLNEYPDSTNYFDWYTGDEYLDVNNNYYRWHLQAIGAYEAWGTTQGSSDITVAVIDGGIYENITDLPDATNIKIESGGPEAVNQHGSHIAGLIGAEYGNGDGSAGVAPNVKIVSYNVYSPSQNRLTAQNMITAINYAVNQGADVINISMGSYLANEYMRIAVEKAVSKGIPVVVSAGNDGSNVKNYPAAYNDVIAVAAVDKNDYIAEFSCWGDWVDISAPGVDMISTTGSGSKYGVANGTSQAAPVVSGVIALYMSVAGLGNGDVNSDGAKDINDVIYITEKLRKTGEKAASKNTPNVVNAANLMETVIEKPMGLFYSGDVQVTNFANPISLTDGESVHLKFKNNSNDYFVVYTLNGKTPKIVDGQVVEGIVYDGNPIDLTMYDDGKYTLTAIAYNGAGIKSATYKQTFTLKWTESRYITARTQDYIVPGKTKKLAAELTGFKDKLVFKVDSDVNPGIKVDGKGNLTVPASYSGGRIRVLVQARTNNHRFKVINVDVVKPSDSIIINSSNGMDIYTGEGTRLSATLVDADGNPLITPVIWKSSNKKVAEVDENGYVTPKAKGSVKITATADDGSKKSASVNLTIAQRVENIEISSPNYDGIYHYAAAGTSLQFTSKVLPAGSNNKKVIYYIDSGHTDPNLGEKNREALEKGITITESGKLTVPAGADYEGIVTVTALAADGHGACSFAEVFIKSQKVSKIKLVDIGELSTFYPEDLIVDEKTGSVTGCRLYMYKDTHQVELVNIKTDTGVPVSFKSSNNDIVTISKVESTGAIVLTVSNKKAGKAVVTFTAMDGSKKTTKLNVEVVPVLEKLNITNDENSQYYGQLNLFPGASYTFKTDITDILGKKVTKGIEWSVDTREDTEYTNPDPENITVTNKGVLKIGKNAQFTDGQKIMVSLYVNGNKTEDGQVGTGAVVTLRKDRPDKLELIHSNNRWAYYFKQNAKGKFIPHNLFVENCNISGSCIDKLSGNDLYEDRLNLSYRAYCKGEQLDWLPPLDISFSGKNLAYFAQATPSTKVIFAKDKTGKGNVVAKTTDGTKLSVTTPINIVYPVKDFNIISDATSVAKGKKITVKAGDFSSYDNKKPTVTKVIWSVDDASRSAGVKISNTGILSVPKYCYIENITVKAVTTDDSNVERFAVFPVVNAPRYVKITDNDDGRITYKNGYINSVNLFTTQVEESDYDNFYMPVRQTDETEITLYAVANTDTSFVWKTSNKAVVSVTPGENGERAVLKGLKRGKATITCTAADGSNVKTSFTVNVTTPPSGIDITFTGSRTPMGDFVVSKGKKAKLLATFRQAFGKPTNSKIKWEIVDDDGVNCKIDQKGNFTVNSKNGTNGIVTVMAKSTDKSGVYSTIEIECTNTTTTKISNVLNMPAYYKSDDLYYTLYGVYCDKSTVNMVMNKNNYALYYFTTDSDVALFTAKSSNPNIAGVAGQYTGADGKTHPVFERVKADNGKQVYVLNKGKYTPLYSVAVYSNGGKIGKAKITVTVADCSNKSFSFNVTVK